MTKQTPPTWERPDLASVPLFTAFGDVTSDAGRPGRVRSAFSLPSSAVPTATSSLHVVGRETQERPSSLSTGAPPEIDWDEASNHLFMTGPAEAVFDGVVTPELWGEGPNTMTDVAVVAAVEELVPGRGAVVSPAIPSSPTADSGIDCAVACVNGCQRPDDCPSAAIRARALDLINSSSLDDLVALATNSLESRTRARFERDTAL